MRTAPSRRDLLRGAAALGGTALLTESRALAAQEPGGQDYRALVCVNLTGGVDGWSFALPRGPEHAAYAAGRQALALSREVLLPLHPERDPGMEIGMSPELPELASRFERGDLAVVANVGPLAAPTTKDAYLSGKAPLPPFLFSHSDQTEQWRIARADRPSATGWCGRMADRMTAANAGSPLPLCISLAGETKLLVGAETAPYYLSTRGSEPILALSEDRLRGALERTFGSDLTHPMQRRWARVAREAIEIDALLAEALADAPDFAGLLPDGHPLAEQLRAVARVIAVREVLGVRRQVFFVDQNGYDTHEAQDVFLPRLLTGISRVLDAFQTALEQIGATPDVVTFTTSEFGRTLVSNGKGTDHAWANHQLAIGGPVLGKNVHGPLPALVLGGPDDIEQGRIVPRRAVEQYAATLARWFGLPESELDEVFPNLARFDSSDLGFLRPA